MAARRQLVFLLAGVLASLGASYRTTNFVVEAATPAIAQQVGQLAERYRREKALEWLGQEMPPWPEPCPIRVKVTFGSPGGATSFAFDRGRVLGQHMNIEGPLDRILNSVLPHEITHTVFAHHFRSPVPRWADEGGSVLSEDETEKARHDQLVRQILNQGRGIPLRRLFALREYPNDVMCLYAQGFSVVQFLVSMSSRPAFLNFVAHGMYHGWDAAVQVHYRYQNVDELEQAWLSYLRATRRQPPTLLARNESQAPTEPAQRTIVRLTAPPVQPLQDNPAPTYRGQSPDDGDARHVGRPPLTLPSPASPGNWRAAGERFMPATRLGEPEPLSPRYTGQGGSHPLAPSNHFMQTKPAN